jgi:hypothetical protein
VIGIIFGVFAYFFMKIVKSCQKIKPSEEDRSRVNNYSQMNQPTSISGPTLYSIFTTETLQDPSSSQSDRPPSYSELLRSQDSRLPSYDDIYHYYDI